MYEENWMNLMNAVVVQAANDYRKHYRRYKQLYKDKDKFPPENGEIRYGKLNNYYESRNFLLELGDRRGIGGYIVNKIESQVDEQLEAKEKKDKYLTVKKIS